MSCFDAVTAKDNDAVERYAEMGREVLAAAILLSSHHSYTAFRGLDGPKRVRVALRAIEIGIKKAR